MKPRHEQFCQTYMTSPMRYVRYNATQSYLKVYWNANPNTASTNGSRLVAKHWGRIMEIYYEEQRKRQSGYQLDDYHRRVEKKFNPNRHQHSPKLDQSQDKPKDQRLAQDVAIEAPPKPYQLPKNQMRDENEPERDPWDGLV